jgi:uncharacterized phage-like protein YoqJ
VIWPTVCATGPRDVPAGAEPWVRAELARCAVWLREQGTRYAVSGMARGVDLWWADAAVTAGLELCAAIPFAEQTDPWSKADRAEWTRIRALATRAHIVGVLPADVAPRQRSTAVNRLLHARNDFMLDRSAAVVAVWECGKLDGGTHGALVKAARRGLPGIWLDPAARSIVFELPGLADLLKHAIYHAGCGCVVATGIQADMEILRAAYAAAGLRRWRIRAARPREVVNPDGCHECSGPDAPVGSRLVVGS